MTILARAVRYGPDFLLDGNSRAARGVAVTIKDSNGNTANVYNGPERSPVANPVNTGMAGELDVHLDAGGYTLTYLDPADGVTTITKRIVVSNGSLSGGRYPFNSPWQALLGNLANVADPTQPARSNLEWFGLGNETDGALAATGVCCAVAIPVDPGQVITKVSLIVGATPESGGSHAFAAVYSGIAVPGLIGQATDVTGAAAIGASARFDFSLTAAQKISAAQAPNGFVYASISITGTVPTALVVATPAGINYQWTPNGPLFLAMTHGAAVAGTAPATIASPAAKAVAPIVILT
jgi:hypothetical protein